MDEAPPVLAVDDEADLLETYARLLRAHHLDMVATSSVREALAALGARPPRLVITDLRLPDGTGLDVVRAARAAAPPPPVIVVTAYPSPQVQREVTAAGAQAYLAKPFTAAAFSRLIARLAGPLPVRA